jgi:hypothetical protein
MNNAFALARVILDRAVKLEITDEQIERIRLAYDSRRNAITDGDQHRQAIFILSILLAVLPPNPDQRNKRTMKTNPTLPKELLAAISSLPGDKRIAKGIEEKIGQYDRQIKNAGDEEIERAEAIAAACNSILDCFFPPLKRPDKEAASAAIEKWRDEATCFANIERMTEATAPGVYSSVMDREGCQALSDRLESVTKVPAARWPSVILRLMSAGTHSNLIELYARSAHRLSVLMNVPVEDGVASLLEAKSNPLPVLTLILEKIENPKKERQHETSRSPKNSV